MCGLSLVPGFPTGTNEGKCVPVRRSTSSPTTTQGRSMYYIHITVSPCTREAIFSEFDYQQGENDMDIQFEV